jgi:hypothetical protein
MIPLHRNPPPFFYSKQPLPAGMTSGAGGWPPYGENQEQEQEGTATAVTASSEPSISDGSDAPPSSSSAAAPLLLPLPPPPPEPPLTPDGRLQKSGGRWGTLGSSSVGAGGSSVGASSGGESGGRPPGLLQRASSFNLGCVGGGGGDGEGACVRCGAVLCGVC